MERTYLITSNVQAKHKGKKNAFEHGYDKKKISRITHNTSLCGV